MIITQSLSKVFEGKNNEQVYAVKDLSFTVNNGEIVCLLGVNGAGKTTTMRMLSTIFSPTSGTATIENYDIITQPQLVRSNLGFLSGDTGLYARLTARECIQYFGRLFDVSDKDIDRRIEKMANLLSMNEFLNKRIDAMSTGMKQKVSIVRSIIHDPPVMIFDEPTSGLDILTARNIVSFIQQCKAEGKTVLFSTHNMREAERLSDRIVLIHKGILMAEGTLSELRDKTDLLDLDDIFVYYINKYFSDKDDTHELA